MSEMIRNSSFNVPPDQDFNTLSFQGSMQQVLQDNVGKFVIVEFLIGTGNLTSRQGILFYVGSQFLVLLEEYESRYMVCDIFSVKFVTFLERQGATTYPMQDTSFTQQDGTPATDTPAAEAFSPSQAAYAHATRRNPSVRY